MRHAPSPIDDAVAAFRQALERQDLQLPPGDDAQRCGLLAVRKRAKQHRLVAFQADDREWLFPAWQFDQVGGPLTPHPAVLELWQQLPHDAWMAPANLAVWMNGRLRSLDATPVEHAREHGLDQALARAVSRLAARLRGNAA